LYASIYAFHVICTSRDITPQCLKCSALPNK
jgi:hypothetical protein